MKSYQVLKLHNFHLATRGKFPFILNIIILISRPISDKFTAVLEKNTAIPEIIPFHQSRVNIDCLPGNFSLTLSILIHGFEIVSGVRELNASW